MERKAEARVRPSLPSLPWTPSTHRSAAGRAEASAPAGSAAADDTIVDEMMLNAHTSSKAMRIGRTGKCGIMQSFIPASSRLPFRRGVRQDVVLFFSVFTAQQIAGFEPEA